MIIKKNKKVEKENLKKKWKKKKRKAIKKKEKTLYITVVINSVLCVEEQNIPQRFSILVNSSFRYSRNFFLGQFNHFATVPSFLKFRKFWHRRK